MTWFNLSGTLSLFRVLRDPSLCLPHQTIPTFNSLPVPLTVSSSSSSSSSGSGSSSSTPTSATEKTRPDIRAIVLDKDNCFALPHSNEIYPAYHSKFSQLRAAYPGARLLIVSNTAGTASSDADGAQAAQLERTTGVRVLRHATKKPGCHGEVMAYLRGCGVGVEHGGQVAVVGDRLMTDVVMANLMGAHGVWVRDGVSEAGVRPSLFARMEARLATFLIKRGYVPQTPRSPFE